jgi:serine phosphatase RsbU (regulator of sigma subunit)/pSer/pThr/pTyr-binding forkhead associated (FHA) protein
MIRDSDGGTTLVPLDRDRITLGRSSAAQLCYPDDSGLSRQHMALVRIANQWHVEDLGSKNGTLLNGGKVERPLPFNPGDRISAGHLTIEFSDERNDQTVVFVDGPETASSTATTVVANLDAVLATPTDDPYKTNGMQGTPQMRALIRAGRELVEHRPLDELFTVIMDLSVEAVMAGRGVLMTLEEGELKVSAARGEGFQISRAVRDRVIAKRESLLVRDAMMDKALREQQSIVAQQVRSMIAVPLQTNDKVIGLIYVDQPHMLREFTREDLNLLTVMANVAAIRIENARLVEIETAERAMAQEMEQAAQIQLGLLPKAAPRIRGLEIAGRTAAARVVGGDYYDFIPYADGRIGMIVADVAGKGMPASLIMTGMHARVHVLFEEPGDLGAKITRLNRQTCGNTPENRFITFFMIEVDPSTGQMTYCNAGHNPALLIRKSGEYELLKEGGLILGILPQMAYKAAPAQLNAGDLLVMFTDGVTEAVNTKDEDFGEDRLRELVEKLRDRPVSEIVDTIHQAVNFYAQGMPQFDDITVVVVRKLE